MSTATSVALEEHFIIPSFLDYLAQGMPNVPDDAKTTLIRRLLDFGEERLSEMDAGGVRKSVLSISGPGVQCEPDVATATRRAAEANDALADVMAQRPDRYGGFAHLAMQDPGAAADELERCIRDLGFSGAMINNHTLGVYLDDARNDVFWERLQHLDVPLYLHPGDSFRLPYVFEGAPELVKPTWEWTTETASHALRLIVTGVFDRYPRAQVILGHMGETLPFMLWRLDSRYAFTATDRRVQRNPSDYLRDNFSVTTSGQCSDVPLLASLASMGQDRVMYSIDYPYESSDIAGRFMETAAISEDTRALVGHRNAEAILKLTS
ncbi:MAG: 2,3-dihydroxybenzoate decarboxylase [Mycobacterium sp.]|jgi:2,3-dihydroxybenzoate decarboxylase|nr:2,3-dihydroxybenzoate decarboxylase [Mycobacterium sp.]